MISWRALTCADIPDVVEIAAIAHPDYPEEAWVIANRLGLFEAGCMLAERDETAAGYMLSHPWRRGNPVALNYEIDGIPADADCLYIHDLALTPESRGTGAAQLAVSCAADIAGAHGFEHLAIVALPGAIPFWRRQGFEPHALDSADLERKYGRGALYMERRIPSDS